MGCASSSQICESIAHRPVSDASVYEMKGRLKISQDQSLNVKAFLICWNAISAAGIHFTHFIPLEIWDTFEKKVKHKMSVIPSCPRNAHTCFVECGFDRTASIFFFCGCSTLWHMRCSRYCSLVSPKWHFLGLAFSQA